MLFEQNDLFVSGTNGYHSYNIPALITTSKSAVLAFCEGRKNSICDEGDIDILVKRSTDQGKTWSGQRIVFHKGGAGDVAIGNPCLVEDESTGNIWLAFCRNNQEVFVCHSSDDGVAWSEPKNITGQVKEPEWTWYATGPGVGIQLKHGQHRGRLIIPCDHGSPDPDPTNPDRIARGVDGESYLFLAAHGFRSVHPMRRWCSHVIYSDDQGRTWNRGEPLGPGSNECQLVELADPPGRLMMNMRMQSHRQGKRGVATSTDGGQTWSPITHDPNLPCPTCQASIICYAGLADTARNILLFSNPATDSSPGMTTKLCYEYVKAPNRNGMTVRASYDDGKSWSASKLIYAGSSAYSCLSMITDKTIGLLYTRDDITKLSLATFDLEWLEAP